MPRVRRTAATIVTSLLLPLLVIVPASVASGQPSVTSAAPSQTVAGLPAAVPVKQAKKKKKGYRVRPGLTFNSAVGPAGKRRAIVGKVNRAITHTKNGDTIRIMSWKIWTYAGVTRLLKAQKRGVKIQVLMDKKNTIVENNPHFWRLRNGLAAGNKKIGNKKKHSRAKLCTQSCRGKGGAAHSKFFLFSKAGRSRYVYMSSSANWGDAAANRQWNDMYTFVGDKQIYDFATKIFQEMWRDKPAKRPWQTFTKGKKSQVTAAFAPRGSKGRTNDPLAKTLQQVRCKGAQPAGGGNRTKIRVAPDVIRGEQGMKIARLLRKLWDQGCDVKVGHTVMGVDVMRLLRANRGRGPVPVRHLVQDHDGDGIFDRYFHLKVYTINGYIGNDRSATFVQHGSANTSRLADISDENIVYFRNYRKLTTKYQNHIDYWFRNFPASKPLNARAMILMRAGYIDPYQNMELD